MPIFHTVDQRTPQWFNLRKGIPCTSGFANIVTPLGKPTGGNRRRAYMHRLACERLIGRSTESNVETFWTVRGKEMEGMAAQAFAERTGVVLSDGAFCTNDEQTIGCSPDRLVWDTTAGPPRPMACVEMKCPSPWVHVGYLADGPGNDYKQQVQGQLLITGCEINHFWSFHPQCPPCHIPTTRDEDFIAILVRELAVFNDELDTLVAELQLMGTWTPGPEWEVPIPGTFPWMNEAEPLQ